MGMSSMAIFGVLHVLSGLAIVLGVLFFAMWAHKTFTAGQLKMWALWLFIGGFVVCFLTTIVGGPWKGSMMNRGMMKDDAEDDGAMMEP